MAAESFEVCGVVREEDPSNAGVVPRLGREKSEGKDRG